MSFRRLILIAAAGAALASCQTGSDTKRSDAGLAPGSRPNILLIVADDLGYLDLGVFGSEIETPNIDALAAQGLILTNFYAAPMCAPTRAMLLSGMDNHRAGVGAQGGPLMGRSGYEGVLSDRLATLPERLSAAGYYTAMAGKWHLGIEPENGPAARGFTRSFALLDGGASHWADMRGYQSSIPVARYAENGVPVERLPEGFYSTIAYTDRMIGYIDEALAEEEPFFGWLAYTAPHWPVHALDEDMAKTRGRYDKGYDIIRRRRFARWKELGFAPADAELPRVPVDYEPWDALSPEEQALSVRTMEAYAAMVERMDAEIGRLLAHLEERGALENTLVIFMSDNGAEGNDETWATVADFLPQFDNSLDNIGRPGSYRFIGRGWAEAGSAPFLLRKTFATEGGVHVPAIVSAPGLGAMRGRSDAVAAVFDLAPTLLELAGATDAPEQAPADLLPITGRSFAGLLRGEPGAARGETEAIAWEMHGHRAVRRGRWKAEWILPPHGPGVWQLFDLAEDPAERDDLASAQPEILAQLTAEWDKYAAANGVIVIE